MGTVAVAALGGFVLATELPAGVAPVAGSSAAVAELLARSPGARIGGLALKAKAPRVANASAPPSIAPDAGESPRNAFASVLGASTGSEGAIPGTSPIGPGGFPTDFINPVAPSEAAGNTSNDSAPGGEPRAPIVFGPVPPPPAVGSPIFGPAGPGTPATPPAISTTPPAETVPVGPLTPGVPEPASWLMMILGFGVIGQALRTKLRVRMA